MGADQRRFTGTSPSVARKKKAPSAGLLRFAHPLGCLWQAVSLGSAFDAQSVKVANHPGVRGYDAGKKIRGRKRHLVVDTLGLVLGVVVTAASLSDRAGALEVLPPILRAHAGLELLWADAGYAGGTLAADLQAHAAHPDLRLEIIKRSDAAPKGFAVQPRRWVVERSFGWLMQARRLARDYETKPTSSKAIILAQSIRIMLRSLAK